MSKKRIATIVAVLAVAALLIKGKSLLTKRQEEVASQPTPTTEKVSVPVVKSMSGTMVRHVRYSAQLKSDKNIALSTKLAGYIREVRVNESQHVHKGDVLVRIDADDINASLRSLQAALAAQEEDLELARRIYERNQKLYRIGGLAKEQLDRSRIAMRMKASVVETTRSKIDQLKHQLDYLTITAPFDGTIDEVILHEGDLAVAGKPILRMSNTKQKLTFSFAPGKEKITSGLAVLYNGKQIGKIRTVYPTSTHNGLATAEVALDTSLSFPIGSTLFIKVATKRAQGCILPDTTVLHTAQGNFVMVYQQGRFHPQKVRVLLEDHHRIVTEACPKGWIASAAEVKLSTLPAYRNVQLIKPKEDGSHE